MTYDGAGFSVQELIRKEIAARPTGSVPPVEPVSHEMPVETAADSNAETNLLVFTTVPGLPTEAGEQPAAEIRQLLCIKDGDVRSTVLELLMDKPVSPLPEYRICSVDRVVGDEHVHFWHAHHQQSSCIAKFNEIAIRNLQQGRECVVSVGVRYGVNPVIVDAAR